MSQRREKPIYREPARRSAPPPPRRGRPARKRRTPVRSKQRKSLIWVPVLLVLLLAVWFTLANYVFVVRSIEVEGVGSVSPDVAARACGIPLGTRLNAINPEVVRANVDATGVLCFVSLDRRYPTTLRLTVRERSRDAMILQSGKLLILDADGYVVSAESSAPEKMLPYVVGLKPTTYRIGKQLDVTPERLEAMKAVLDALRVRQASAYVSELDLESAANIKALSRTGMTVLLGDASNMDAKVAWMVEALRDLESRGETLGRLDVSSGTKADYLPAATVAPTPQPTQNTYLLDTPTPAPTESPAEEAVIGEDAI